jgi:hypothetical protein
MARIHVWPFQHTSLVYQGWLTCMQTHTHSHYDAFGPGMSGKGTLGSHCCLDSLSGANKNDEETIPLRIDLITVMFSGEQCNGSRRQL